MAHLLTEHGVTQLSYSWEVNDFRPETKVSYVTLDYTKNGETKSITSYEDIAICELSDSYSPTAMVADQMRTVTALLFYRIQDGKE